LDAGDKEILETVRMGLDRKGDSIKDRIRADIEKVKIEIEELALEKQRLEVKRKIGDKMKKLESLKREMNRKRNSGLRYQKEMQEAKKLKGELGELQKELEKVPESGLIIEVEDPKIVGGCMYVS